jgi:hypothetical protein
VGAKTMRSAAGTVEAYLDELDADRQMEAINES